jgi:mRNA interferase RelE/StbE
MYTIIISESAFKQLNKLQKPIVKKIELAINKLSENPRPIGVKKLKGIINEDLYRIRSGDYRIVYSIEDKVQIVDIRKIGHRKDIYK